MTSLQAVQSRLYLCTPIILRTLRVQVSASVFHMQFITTLVNLTYTILQLLLFVLLIEQTLGNLAGGVQQSEIMGGRLFFQAVVNHKHQQI